MAVAVVSGAVVAVIAEDFVEAVEAAVAAVAVEDSVDVTRTTARQSMWSRPARCSIRART